MKNKRPVNLDLTSLKFPPMAIASILHRISGVLLFVILPFMLYLLQQSLLSEASFAQLGIMLTHPLVKFVIWVFLSALCFHLLAGIRHLIMDYGLAEHLLTARRSALGVIVIAILLDIIIGIKL